MRVDRMWHAQSVEDLLNRYEGVRRPRDFRQQHHNFIAAETADGIAAAHASLQYARY